MSPLPTPATLSLRPACLSPGFSRCDLETLVMRELSRETAGCSSAWVLPLRRPTLEGGCPWGRRSGEARPWPGGALPALGSSGLVLSCWFSAPCHPNLHGSGASLCPTPSMMGAAEDGGQEDLLPGAGLGGNNSCSSWG